MSATPEQFTLSDLVYLPLDQVDARDGFAVRRDDAHRNTFAAAYDTLDSWLPSANAEQMHVDGQIHTTVAMYQGQPVGYIATHAYSLHDSHEGAKAFKFVKPYSALKVLHLAVDGNYEGRGIARDLLQAYGIGAAATLSLFTGCRFVFLDALTPAIPFYTRHHFKELPVKKPSSWSTPMLFDLAASPERFAMFRKLARESLQLAATPKQ